MKKLFIKLNSLFAVLMGSVFIFAQRAYADGSPYSPYGGHNPVDTSLGGLTDLLIVAGIVAYIVGTVFIVNSKKIKSIISA